MSRPRHGAPESAALVEQCYVAALRLLSRNLRKEGILAASPTPRARQRHYHHVFARDAGVCALAMARSGNDRLVVGARASLRTLARQQAANGQIPKFVSSGPDGADFWYVGCIDATLWWLIAAWHVTQLAPDRAFKAEMAAPTRRALAWVSAQEHPRLRLVTQNEASDWADIMPRSGFVLYSNALWYYVKRLYELPALDETYHYFNSLFYPFSGEVAEYRRLRLLNHFVRRSARDNGLYLSFVNFSFWGEEGDVFGNLLAVLVGLADDARASAIVHRLERSQIEQPAAVRGVLEPIGPYSPLWRDYMGRHRQNLVYQYHNGGCWPLVGGFWAMALAALGNERRARAALENLARTNAVNNWQFNEWFHGLTGEPMGMPGQSWNAASYLLAAASLEGKVFLDGNGIKSVTSKRK
jgi:GH15 family glucan-1,4-alpha-glucosidase